MCLECPNIVFSSAVFPGVSAVLLVYEVICNGARYTEYVYLVYNIILTSLYVYVSMACQTNTSVHKGLPFYWY